LGEEGGLTTSGREGHRPCAEKCLWFGWPDLFGWGILYLGSAKMIEMCMRKGAFAIIFEKEGNKWVQQKLKKGM
jgi:hypothetical protein